jgi:hypothetical protein
MSKYADQWIQFRMFIKQFSIREQIDQLDFFIISVLGYNEKFLEKKIITVIL